MDDPASTADAVDVNSDDTETTPTSAPAHSDAGPPPAPPRLRRSRHDKVVAGVCGGLGQYFGVDPVIFRIAFVVFAFAGGSGLAMYALTWLVLPQEDTDASPIQSALAGSAEQGPKRVVAGVVLALGALALLANVDVGRGRGFVWGLLLIAVGVALLRPPSGGQGPGEPAAVPDPAAPSAPRPSAARHDDEEEEAPSPPEGRSLTSIVVSLLLVGAGGASLLDAAGVLHVSVTGYLSVALLGVGAALVVAARWGRGRGLIPVGFVLVLALGAASFGDFLGVPFRGGAGERVWLPATSSDVRPEYRLGAGELTVDLSRVSVAETGTTVAASVGMGELRVVVPTDAPIVVDGRVGMGELALLDDESEGGFGVEKRLVDRPPGSTGKALRLRLRAGMGRVEVHRAAS